MSDAPIYAPGARLLVRDEEWLVKSTLPLATGGAAVRVAGLSELVRGREAVFLTALESIAELRPEQTKLVPDDSPQYRRTRLYLESLMQRTPPTDDRIYLGHRGAINPAPYQLEPARMALQALRPRILIADGVGLGKTIEAGVLLSELIKRGRGERILVIAIRSMLAQFQQELWARFAIPLVRLDSVGLQRVRAKIPSNKNPFYYYNRVIISVDTLKNDAQYRHYLEQCHWDVILIDECHNVANAGSQRSRLASLLARKCDSLILTSATPHNGRPESFANLMNMLEPTAIADVTDYTAEEIAGLFVRRFKKDIADQVAGQFSERDTHLVKTGAYEPEEAFFTRLARADFNTLDVGGSKDALFRIGVLKAYLSSPTACTETLKGRARRVEERLAKLQGRTIQTSEDPETSDAEADPEGMAQPALLPGSDRRTQLAEELRTDLATLRELTVLAAAVKPADFSKYQRLLTLLRELGAVGLPMSPRVIIFSERIATLGFLAAQLRDEFGVGEDVIRVFHAGLPDVDQTGIVESFGKADSPIRILLASDVASEGVNLHYYCHLMIHFDIPWSLITLEQRNGRIDRYGQDQAPVIHYLLTVSAEATIRGDMRVLDRLIEKEQEAHKNIGDAATLLGLHDAQQEEEYITQAVAAGKPAEAIIPDQPSEVDWLALLTQAAQPTASHPFDDGLTQPLSLYVDDLAFAHAAFDELLEGKHIAAAPEYHPTKPFFSLLAPEDLRRRCEFIPHEAIPRDWTFRLTTDRGRVMQAMADARRREGEWPQEQLFWELHPVTDWLMDKLLVRFGRHEAPVILAPKLHAGDCIYLFQGVLSNQRSQPVISEWFGVHVSGDRPWAFHALAEVLETTGFTDGLPNPKGKLSHEQAIAEALPKVVKAARDHMAELRKKRAGEERKRLQEDTRKLKRWRDATLERIAAGRTTAVGALAARLDREHRDVEALYAQRQMWLTDAFTTVDAPYLRVVAVFAGS
jgi:ERCC4-related helicase